MKSLPLATQQAFQQGKGLLQSERWEENPEAAL